MGLSGDPPFRAWDQLYHGLSIDSESNIVRHAKQSPGIFKDWLPDAPGIALDYPSVKAYLEAELLTSDLNRFWLGLVAKKDNTHISSLTHQRVRGRGIIITEDPGLHLVWIYDRVYVKPLPKYFLSHAFWVFYLSHPHTDSDLVKAARGFVRSYAFLIRHRSDFLLGTGQGEGSALLLPKGVKFEEFIRFIKRFEHFENEHLSPRYAFGDLRLTRLNSWSPVFLGRFNYFKVHGQYGAQFAQYYGPILFVFGIFGVALSAMQVALAVKPQIQASHGWAEFARTCRGLAVTSLVAAAVVLACFVGLFLFKSLREIVFAARDKARMKREQQRRLKKNACIG